ncbi:MAG: RNA-directed DNA polymerase [Anaerolineales bacterium]|nr:RNA-directed DNA polymerase [Anaerolineales bacterium]
MNLNERLIAWENLRLAYANASRGKRGKAPVAGFETLLADNLLELQGELAGQTYQPGRYRHFHVHEPKRRLISAAPFRDRVVHHALCNVSVPYFEKAFIANSFANRAGKGTHKAINACQQYSRGYKYALQCDVRQFFPSIDHTILRRTLKAMLPDDSLLWLVDRILASGRGVLAEEYQMVYFPGDDPSTGSGQGIFAAGRPRGLPIGNLTSQWWANCYLDPFDHFVRRELSCPAYLRFVDDFVLFSDSRSELMDWRAAILTRLARYRLTLHEESAYPRKVTEGLPFLGFVLFPDHRRLKARKGYHFRRRLRQRIEQGTQQQVKDSVQGWLNHVRYGDTFGLSRAMLAGFDLLAAGDGYV